MNFDVDARTILLCRAGSHAYGTNIAGSDEDFRGICVKSRDAYFGFTQRFEQFEHMGSKSDGIDKVIFALEKFASLAADCNPNIIETLFVDESDVIKCDEFGQRLRDVRDAFLSKKAKFTFAGYAHAQLHRIKTHKAWLMNPIKDPPDRRTFGLSDTSAVSKSELGAYDSMLEQKLDMDLPKSVVTLFTREKAYQAAKLHYEQYLGWVKSRNPARAELEAKFGYDTKHGMHLIRLMRMCVEILRDCMVNVKRLDFEDLLDIRYGRRVYESVIEEAEALEALCEQLYLTSKLRREPDREMLSSLVVNIATDYLSIFG